MNTDQQSETRDLDQAQRAVDKSLSTFESAMDELAQAVDEVGEVIQNVMGFARMPKEELRMLGERAKSVMNDIRNNPQPYVLAVGTALAYLGYRSWRRNQRMSAPRFSGDAGY